jgi:hypothetical protein
MINLFYGINLARIEPTWGGSKRGPPLIEDINVTSEIDDLKLVKDDDIDIEEIRSLCSPIMLVTEEEGLSKVVNAGRVGTPTSDPKYDKVDIPVHYLGSYGNDDATIVYVGWLLDQEADSWKQDDDAPQIISSDLSSSPIRELTLDLDVIKLKMNELISGWPDFLPIPKLMVICAVDDD